MDDLMIPEEVIMSRIYLIRGQKIMLDMDLAVLYGVENKQLKRSVRRNIKRFPPDFMFELNQDELEILRCQIGTSNWGGIRYSPMAFTEQGVAMLSSILNSDRAIQVNIRIIRVFTKMRYILESHKEILEKLDELQKKDLEQDQQIMVIFEYLRQLEQARQEEEDFRNRKKIGFRQPK